MPQLHDYLKNIRKNSFSFPCPHCDQERIPEKFEKHYSDQHQLRYCCIWCFGITVWLHDENNVHHLLKFIQKFANLPTLMTTVHPHPIESTLLDLTPMFLAETYFDHAALPEMTADPIWPPKFNPPALPYQDASLNLAVSCLHMYISIRDMTDWFHVMVRPSAFPSFLKALDDGKSGMMTFCCYCDGGDSRDKGHRHMIVVSETKGRFMKHVWKKN